MQVLIMKSKGWGGMPLMRAIPSQLRMLARGNPVAEEWLRLVDASRFQEIVIDDDVYPRAIAALQQAGIIHAGRAVELLL
jgi:hypothetical protein